MAAPIPLIVALGSQLLRIGAKELPKLLKKGAKLIKKPTLTQRKRAVLSKDGKAVEPLKLKQKKVELGDRSPTGPVVNLPRGAADTSRYRRNTTTSYGSKSSKPRKDKDGNNIKYRKVEGDGATELDPIKDLTFKKGGGVKKPRGVGKARQGVRAAKMVVMKGS